MNLTPYHAKYIAYELTLKSTNGIERLAQSLFDAAVDLNPHQIDAAVFALDNPLAEGVVLADEVGLGKTIEAGLVLTQLWAEGKRKLMIICPASLRKQWALELQEKFYLPTVIMDAKQYSQDRKAGMENPLHRDAVVIASIHYAAGRDEDLLTVPWDAVVVDEAHKLRNAYRTSNRLGRKLLSLLDGRRKILLTATPLQNSLMELYGLSLFVDPYLFGEAPHFRSLYAGPDADLADLRRRLKPYVTRTLRKDVLEYVRYTQRNAITQPFEPSNIEQELYDALNAYLQRDDTYAFPTRHRHLSLLIIRKLLASSSHALIQTLEKIVTRLQALLEEHPETKERVDPIEYLLSDEAVDDDLIDQILEDAEDDESDDETDEHDESAHEYDPLAIREEIRLVESFIARARSIHTDSKARALLLGLKAGFDNMQSMGAQRKAVVFTESRRTQEYLRRFLEANGYAGNLVLFNGSNNDPESKNIYQQWLAENEPKGRSSGSRKVDTRTALIEYFRDHAQIMIATEAGSEGINLQFCSLVVNYDLPWNPQRIEQRIGRVHRYGQRFDVVVINFLNTRNQADRRVFELLDAKLTLFQGVFGASDEILGALESGVDFEKRILQIYQTCRSEDEINHAFDALQRELDDQIRSRMAEVRETLLERFDADVHERLRINLEHAQGIVHRTERLFWALTKFVLAGRAHFDNDTFRFNLYDSPIDGAPAGTYVLASQRGGDELSGLVYRLSHPLGEWVIEHAKQLPVPFASVDFQPQEAPLRVSRVEQLSGQQGLLRVDHLVIDGAEREEHVLVSATTDAGASLDPDVAERLFAVPGSVSSISAVHEDAAYEITRLDREAGQHEKAVIALSAERNGERLNDERDKLYRWSEDQVDSLDQELKNAKQQVMRLQREARKALTVDEQAKIEEEIKNASAKRSRLRKEIHRLEDEIENRRDELITKLEARVQQVVERTELLRIRWHVE